MRKGALAALLALAPASTPAASAASTVVSLTFDDGWASQRLGRQILDSRGLKGTFYVINSMLTNPEYMTADDLRSLQAAGHEVGGHTIDHKRLPSLPEPELRRQVCDGRAGLAALGLRVVSFAYPYGASDAAAEAMVRSCGYASGRLSRGLLCPGCPAGETLPPPDAYAVRTPVGVTESTRLEDLEGMVRAVEASGGGWLPIVMHRVCEGCAYYSVRPSILEGFADWLRAREASGTVVRTVGQAVDGAASGPSAPAAAGARVLPDPWRADRHPGRPVLFDRLPPGSTVRLFTVSGRWVRTLEAPGGAAAWDLDDSAGEPVASGFYVFLVSGGGDGGRGLLGVIR